MLKDRYLVGINGQADSPDLSDDETGTRYFVNNLDVITVNEDGLISTLSEGEAKVTVIHGGCEMLKYPMRLVPGIL
jgi:hypothetical protein